MEEGLELKETEWMNKSSCLLFRHYREALKFDPEHSLSKAEFKVSFICPFVAEAYYFTEAEQAREGSKFCR
jgi:hypothetical protein